jgi:hypothetical protein
MSKNDPQRSFADLLAWLLAADHSNELVDRKTQHHGDNSAHIWNCAICSVAEPLFDRVSVY